MIRTNPFYQHYLVRRRTPFQNINTLNPPVHHQHFSIQDSSSNGSANEDDRSRTSDAALDSIFGPPPGFQNTHLDLHSGINTVQHEASSSEPQLDRLQTLLFAGQALDRAPADGTFHHEAQREPVAENRILQPQNSELLKDKGVRVFPAAEGENLFPAARRVEGTRLEKKNLFDTPPSDADISTSSSGRESLQSSRLSAMNPFHQATPKSTNPFSKDSPGKDHLVIRPQVQDLFASPANAGKPSSSSVSGDFFHDFTIVDPFDSPLSKQDDDFRRSLNGATDFFQPLPSKADLFETPRSSASSTPPYGTPSFRVSPDSAVGTTWSSPGFLEEHQSVAPASSQPLAEKPEVVLTTPQGTKQNILQPTPFTRARNLRVPSSQSPPVMTHVRIWNRSTGL